MTLVAQISPLRPDLGLFHKRAAQGLHPLGGPCIPTGNEPAAGNLVKDGASLSLFASGVNPALGSNSGNAHMPFPKQAGRPYLKTDVEKLAPNQYGV